VARRLLWSARTLLSGPYFTVTMLLPSDVARAGWRLARVPTRRCLSPPAGPVRCYPAWSPEGGRAGPEPDAGGVRGVVFPARGLSWLDGLARLRARQRVVRGGTAAAPPGAPAKAGARRGRWRVPGAPGAPGRRSRCRAGRTRAGPVQRRAALASAGSVAEAVWLQLDPPLWHLRPAPPTSPAPKCARDSSRVRSEAACHLAASCGPRSPR